MDRLERGGGSFVCLALGAAAVVVYLTTPHDSAAQLISWFVPCLLAVGLIAVRCRGSSGRMRLSLLLLLWAQAGYVALLAAWYLGPAVFGREADFPSLLDLGFLLDYAIFAAFLISVLRSSAVGRDIEARVAVIDALILTTALSAVLWVGVVLPSLEARASGPATAVALLYPAINLVLCGLAVRVAIDRLSGSGLAGLLLLGWLAPQITGDVVYGVQSAAGTFEFGTPLFVTWMVASTCLAAMVAHPSLSRLLGGRDAATVKEEGDRGLARGFRLFVLYLAAVVPLVMESINDHGSMVLLLMAAVGFALVIMRLALLAGDLHEQRRLAAELEVAGAELLRANEDLRRADEARSVFLATMSHEIRTPMNAIIGMSGIVLDSELTTEQNEHLEIVRGAGENLLALVNDILDFSKIDAGKIELEDSPFVLLECVESAVDLVAPQAAARGLELLCATDHDCPQVVVGDLTRLRQILVNLLTNAVKFTAQGEVLLSVSREGDGGGIRFEVRDTGIGIPPDRLSSVFDSFTQADSSTTRVVGGTGLGLTISRELVGAMGGQLGVESQVGVGSVFFFTIELEQAEVPAGIVRGQRTFEELAGLRVLVVDDNDTNRRILRHQLEAWGVLLEDTEDPLTALEWVREGRRFDLVVLDLRMPSMDGVTLARSLRETPPGRSLPLVLLSSLGTYVGPYPDFDHVARLTKPVKPAALAEAIVEALHGGSSPADHVVQLEASVEGMARLKILVVEDNVVNQRVVLGMLARLGCRPDVAANGLEALDAIHRQPYDVVLMDVQMPEMDGLEATRQIRARLPADRQPHIIALTANALAEDREICLVAGMDDYLSKPLRAAQLVAALTDCKPRCSGPSGPSLGPSLETAVLEALRTDLDDDEFFHDVVERFVGNAASRVETMRLAHRDGDADKLRALAHAMKGTAANFGAQRLSRLAVELEGAAADPHDGRLSELLDALDSEAVRMAEAMEAHQLSIRA